MTTAFVLLVGCNADSGGRGAPEVGNPATPGTSGPTSAGTGPTPRAGTGSPSNADQPTPVDPGSGPEAASDLRGSSAWRLDRPAHQHQIEAYSTRASGVPGTKVGIKVSTTAAGFRVTAYRIGANPGGWGERVWRSPFLPGRRQPDPVLRPLETRTVVAPWRRDLTVDTAGWRPGYYVFKLRAGTGWDTLVPYVVSSETAAGTIALVAPVTTWQAYNAWGGYSLYEGPEGATRSWAVSFDRPYNGATGANDFRTAAFPIVVRAEQLGIPLSYFTNIDLHERPGVLRDADGYASLGHDEYWTTAMRTEVMTARDTGTNLAFFGANTMYWRIRLEARGTGPDRLVVGYRDDAWRDPLRQVEPAEATSRFRDPPVPRPEHDLVGMDYECYPVDASYRVVSPRWWGFRGTGAGYGDLFPGLVGPEADRVYPDGRTPRPLQVLSHTSYNCRGVTTSSQSIYYTTRSRAGVFAAGTLRWGCALVDDCEHPLGARVRRFVTVVTGNVLREFASGPVAARHPAVDNLDDFDLSVVNSVSAS